MERSHGGKHKHRAVEQCGDGTRRIGQIEVYVLAPAPRGQQMQLVRPGSGGAVLIARRLPS